MNFDCIHKTKAGLIPAFVFHSIIVASNPCLPTGRLSSAYQWGAFIEANLHNGISALLVARSLLAHVSPRIT